MREWMDKNYLIKPRAHWEHSGNGAIYSVLFLILCNHEKDFILALSAWRLWQKELGVLWRTPDNKFGAESWDNYLAMGVLALMYHDTNLARSILWSAVKKLGYMKNVPFEFEGKTWKEKLKIIIAPWMGRFPLLWVIMIASAFQNRAVFWSTRNLLKALTSLQKLNLKNASGTQLQWLQRWAIYKMGNPKPMKTFLQSLKDQGTSMRQVMSNYYDEGHTILDGYEAFEAKLQQLS
jgi:hypothetical protein